MADANFVVKSPEQASDYASRIREAGYEATADGCTVHVKNAPLVLRLAGHVEHVDVDITLKVD